MEREFLSVHDSHCCKVHGCKYGDRDCPVVLGKEEGIFCEECIETMERLEKQFFIPLKDRPMYSESEVRVLFDALSEAEQALRSVGVVLLADKYREILDNF